MPLGPSWAYLWQFLALLNACWALWGRFGVVLGALWARFGLHLELTWAHLGCLGPFLGKLGPNLIENVDLYFALGKTYTKNLSLGTPALPREAPRSVTMRGGLHPPACEKAVDQVVPRLGGGAKLLSGGLRVSRRGLGSFSFGGLLGAFFSLLGAS